jgi:quercetin dioxygenase-like cupin family protein
MQVYDTGLNKGKKIQEFGSTGVTMSTLINSRAWHVALMKLEPNGLMGAHKVATDQLVVFVQGSARVSGEDGNAVDIVPGAAAFWNRGERHETRAGSQGCLAVVIEGDKLAQSLMMTIRRVTG